MTMSRRKLSCIVVFLITAICFSQTSHAEQAKVLKVGIVPQLDPVQMRINWEPLFFILAKRLDLKIKFVDAQTIPEFEKKLANAEFDLVYLNPFHMLSANKAQGYLPLVRDVGSGLTGIIVSRKDSQVTDVRQLDGLTVSFPAPNALGAAIIPIAELRSQYNTKVEPKYMNTHDATYREVVLGRVVAGGGVMKTFLKQSTAVQDALRIIYKTEEIVSHPIAAHPRLPSDMRDQITRLLLGLSEDVDGRIVLAKVGMKQLGPARVEDFKALEKKGFLP